MIEPTVSSDETVRLQCLHSLKVLDTEPEERFDRITRLARRLFDVPIALVSLVDSDRQWFKSRVGLAATETTRKISFCGHVILDSEVFVVENAVSDKRFCDNPLVAGDPSIRFYAGYPLHSPDGLRLGTLCVIDREPREFSKQDRRTLKELGEMVQAELFSLRTANTDKLTGLTNRRGFYAIVPFALALARRQRLAASLVMVDLDNLYRINRDLGNEAGDRALQEFARCLIKSCRETDVVARIGGGVFCGLFTGSGDSGVESSLERLQQAVEAENGHRDCGHPITYTAGCIKIDPESELAIDSLMRRAEVAMFRAKTPRRRAPP